jgi:hypothetical protein
MGRSDPGPSSRRASRDAANPMGLIGASVGRCFGCDSEEGEGPDAEPFEGESPPWRLLLPTGLATRLLFSGREDSSSALTKVSAMSWGNSGEITALSLNGTQECGPATMGRSRSTAQRTAHLLLPLTIHHAHARGPFLSCGHHGRQGLEDLKPTVSDLAPGVWRLGEDHEGTRYCEEQQMQRSVNEVARPMVEEVML